MQEMQGGFGRRPVIPIRVGGQLNIIVYCLWQLPRIVISAHHPSNFRFCRSLFLVQEKIEDGVLRIAQCRSGINLISEEDKMHLTF